MGYKPEVFDYGGYGVNCKISRMDTGDKDIAWVRGNSFVLVDSPERGHFMLGNQRVDLVSINGIGEIRWPVWERDIESALRYEKEGKLDSSWDCAMHLQAFRWLGLRLRKPGDLGVPLEVE